MWKDACRPGTWIPAVVVAMALAGNAIAADLTEPGYGAVPEPEISNQVGIWGAIAFAEQSAKYGIFWGADERGEAEDIALKHCEKQAQSSCKLVLTYRNHRHWNDNDGSGFPYNYCAALAVKFSDHGKVAAWGVASSKSRKGAEQEAVEKCGADGTCKVLESGCT